MWRSKVALKVCLLVTARLLFDNPKADTNQIVALLRESVRLSDSLDADDKQAVLLTAGDTALHVDPKLAENWATELFRFSRVSMTSHQRASAEKNALVLLSRVNVPATVELFPQLDLPDPDFLTYEDSRVDAAGPIFHAFWSQAKTRALPTISSLADGLGKTGQYPYQAMQEIILLAGPREAVWAQSTMDSAQLCYRSDPGYPSSSLRYANFLIATAPVARADTLRSGLSELIQELDVPIKASKQKAYTDFSQDDKKVRLSTVEDAILYKLLPVVRKIDPLWAEAILGVHKNLSKLSLIDFTRPYTERSVTLATPNTPESAIEPVMDELTAQSLGQQAKTDASAALEQIGLLTPAAQIEATLRILPYYAKTHQTEANGLFDKSRSDVRDMEDSVKKLRLELLISQAAFSLGRSKDGLQIVDEAMDQGETIFASDREAQPGKTFFVTAGADELLKLSLLVAQYSDTPDSYLARIRRSHDDDIKAELLVFFARGLINRQHPGSYI